MIKLMIKSDSKSMADIFPERAAVSEGQNVGIGLVVVVPEVVQTICHGQEPDIVVGRGHLLPIINTRCPIFPMSC